MTEAWQVRQYQQQQLIEELVKEVFDTADFFGEFESKEFDEQEFLFDFGVAVFQYLKRNKEKALTPAYLLLRNIIENDIKPFVRVTSEVNYLIHMLFVKLSPSIFSRATEGYLRDSVHNQKETFSAPAMTDIPHPNDH